MTSKVHAHCDNQELPIGFILPTIPPRSHRKSPDHSDYRRYLGRSRVEHMFGKLKQQRRIATRYDKNVLSSESFLKLAAARLWRLDAIGGKKAEAARGRKRVREAARCEPKPPQRDASGRYPPKNVRPDRAREIVGYLQASYQVSERRPCGALAINRSTQRYQSRRPDQADLKMRIKDLVATRVHYGYRRLHVLLRREGWRINHKRTHRLYREMGLQLRSKAPKRRVKAKLRDNGTLAVASNDCWSMDFLSDQLFDGRKIRISSIIDNFSRLSPALDVRQSYRGADVVETLESLAAIYGRPKRIRLDNGPEFISKDLDLWA